MSSPYSSDAQIFTFGVHGTNNTPDNVREVSRRISAEVGATTSGANLWDNGFDWRAQHTNHTYQDEYGREQVVRVPVAGTSHTMNGTNDRQIASQRLADHVLQQVDKAIEAGTLDRSKPLTINLVGFSHGGNVSILASDEIAEGLRQRRIDSAIHLTTLSTPAYTRGPEDPGDARALVQAEGVRFSHTHFNTPGDGVIRGALARFQGTYPTDDTTNFTFERAPFGINGLANHGAVQDVDEVMNWAADNMRRRFNGLAPAQRQSDAGDDVRVAGVDRPASAPGVDWPTFLASNPLAQQAATALHRAAPEVPQDNLNPSLIAGVAAGAARHGMPAVESVQFNAAGNLVVSGSDHRNPDPAANVTLVSASVGHQPLETVVRDLALAQEANVAQRQPVTALEPTPGQALRA